MAEDSFESLEKEFQEVLNELVGNQSLDKFKVAYEKLTSALKKSNESEKRLQAKCKAMNTEIQANAVKVAAALKLTQEDQTTITSLKKEIEKSWQMVDSAYDNEMRAKETVQTLKHEIANLTKLAEQGAGLSVGHENNVVELLQQKEEWSREREALLAKVVTLEEQYCKVTADQRDMELQEQKAQEAISKLQQDIQGRQNESLRETRRKEKLEKEMKQLQASLEASLADNKALSLQTDRSKDNLQKLEQQLREHKIQNERISKDLEQLQVRHSRLQQENDQQVLSLEQLTLEGQQRAADLKIKEDEGNQMRQEIGKLTKMREAVQKKLRQTEDVKLDVEQQRDTLKNQKVGLERESEATKKQMEVHKKERDELLRDRDILNKNMMKLANAMEKQQDLVKLQDQSKKNLDKEIMNYRDEAQKQRSIIYQLEKERDRLINQASDFTHKGLQHMDELKAREMEIFEYKKQIAEVEDKLKQQQKLYEDVRHDRNLYSKNLLEAQDQITEMNGKLNMGYHQIDQLREEINAKEVALVKEHLEFQRVEKEKEGFKAELQKLKQQAQETRQFIDNQEAEHKELLKLIADADAERLRQRKELNQVVRERDILGTQLVRRNDEVALLYEKIKLLQSVLNKGERQYKERMDDIRLLTMEVKRLKCEKGVQSKTVASVENLRRELIHMQKELNVERNRCRALQEEMQTPMNIHRWRGVEARDPGTFELIQKIQCLQKRLIGKTKEVVDKQLELQEKEKLYVELKQVLYRRPGPEDASKLLVLRHALKKKENEMKGLLAEANLYQSLSKQHQQDLDKRTQEMQGIKKKYLALKRKDQLASEQARSQALDPAQPQALPHRSDVQRFTGGGFNFSKKN